ncbi:hypothetical protein OG21DRAFT_1524929 [Imleria badia]|nr:hypothetical protein OG21DRAFT_1524929 [Imleria badia]
MKRVSREAVVHRIRVVCPEWTAWTTRACLVGNLAWSNCHGRGVLSTVAGDESTHTDTDASAGSQKRNMAVQLNKNLINTRLKSIYNGWNNASVNDGVGSIANADALLLLSGDPAAEDKPVRKGTAFQTWLLGFEFLSSFLLFNKQKILVLSSASKANVLQQLIDGNPPPRRSNRRQTLFPKFIEAYSTYTRVATLVKEIYHENLITEWNQGIDSLKLANKPEQVDMAPALSTVISGTILDKEAKITHEQFAGQIEWHIGTGDSEDAKGPDMKVWSKGWAERRVFSFFLIEFRDSAYLLSSKNGRQLKTNVVFNLVLGFYDLVDESESGSGSYDDVSDDGDDWDELDRKAAKYTYLWPCADLKRAEARGESDEREHASVEHDWESIYEVAVTIRADSNLTLPPLSTFGSDCTRHHQVL